MKVIDLLNKIANGEEVPKEIKYMDTIYTFDECYEDNWKYSVKRNGTIIGLLEDSLYYKLTDEVEIIEEDKKIEKLGMFEEAYCDSAFDGIVFKKINELIEVINEKM